MLHCDSIEYEQHHISDEGIRIDGDWVSFSKLEFYKAILPLFDFKWTENMFFFFIYTKIQ